jgi:hypothetical protein
MLEMGKEFKFRYKAYNCINFTDKQTVKAKDI